MTMVNDNKSQKNKKKPNYNTEANPRGKSNKNYVKASAPQRVLHQPASQQGTETPGTQWKEIDSVVNTLNEIDSVVNTLNKLSLQYFVHRNNFRGGGLNRI